MVARQYELILAAVQATDRLTQQLQNEFEDGDFEIVHSHGGIATVRFRTRLEIDVIMPLEEVEAHLDGSNSKSSAS